MAEIVKAEDGYHVIYASGWATFAETLDEAEDLAGTKSETRIYASGTKYHAPAKLIRKSDGMYRTVCGQRGWMAGSTRSLSPCSRCY